MDWESTASITDLYAKLGNEPKAQEYGRKGIELCQQIISSGNINKEMEFYELLGKYRYLHTVIADIAYTIKDFSLAESTLLEQKQKAQALLQAYGTESEFGQYVPYVKENIQFLENRMLAVQMEEAAAKGGKKGKEDFIKKTIDRLMATGNKDSILLARQMEFLITPDNSSVAGNK